MRFGSTFDVALSDYLSAGLGSNITEQSMVLHLNGKKAPNVLVLNVSTAWMTFKSGYFDGKGYEVFIQASNNFGKFIMYFKYRYKSCFFFLGNIP